MRGSLRSRSSKMAFSADYCHFIVEIVILWIMRGIKRFACFNLEIDQQGLTINLRWFKVFRWSSTQILWLCTEVWETAYKNQINGSFVLSTTPHYSGSLEWRHLSLPKSFLADSKKFVSRLFHLWLPCLLSPDSSSFTLQTCNLHICGDQFDPAARGVWEVKWLKIGTSIWPIQMVMPKSILTSRTWKNRYLLQCGWWIIREIEHVRYSDLKSHEENKCLSFIQSIDICKGSSRKLLTLSYNNH